MASWTTPTTHASGDTLAVTDWNSVANNETFLYQAPHASYYNSVAVSVPNMTVTQITLGGTTTSGYGFSVSSNNVVIPIAGIFTVLGQTCINGIPSGIYCDIYQNGTIKKQSIQTGSQSFNTANSGGMLSCAISDTIALYVYQSSGGALNTQNSAANTFIDIYFVGSA